MAAAESSRARTYGNWQRPRTAGILGLGSLGTSALFVMLIALVLTVVFAGLLEALIMAAALGVLLLAVTVRDVHGRSTVQRIGARVGWWSSRSGKSHLYRSGPLGRVPWGTCQLPGLAAGIRLSEHEDSYGRKFALLYTPATGTYSVVISSEPEGSALVDPETIDNQVASWGHWLANLADEPDVEAASVTIETAPDTGSQLRQEVEISIDPAAPEFAQRMLWDTVESYPAGSSKTTGFVTLSFRAAPRGGGKRRKPEEMGRELAARLPGLTAGLQTTGAGGANPLSAQGLCEIIRVAYDPVVAPLIEGARAAGTVPDLSWPDSGPSAAQASWDNYRHDSGISRTWAMTGAPRGNVQSNILVRLLAPHRDIARKRITMLFRPVDPARAAAMVEADVNAASFRTSAKGKPSARDALELRSAQATAAEEAAGAGLVMFGMLVTATILEGDDAADANAAITNLGAAARLRLRPVYGSQDSAFAAALPLGLILSKHLQIPSEIRERI